MSSIRDTVREALGRAPLDDGLWPLDRIIDAPDLGQHRPLSPDHERPRILQQSAASAEVNLHLIVRSTIAVECRMTGLVRRPDGSLNAIGPDGKGFQFLADGTREARQLDPFSIGSGSQLVSLSIIALSAVAINRVWVTVQITRPLPDLTLGVVETILSGSLTATHPLTWPGSGIRSPLETGGALQSQRFPAPAVGTNFAIIVPSNVRWELIAMYVVLTTSATPGQRYPTFVQDDVAVTYTFLTFSPFAPGPGVNLSCAISPFGSGLTRPDNGVVAIPWTSGLMARAGERYRSDNILAGDQWSDQILYYKEYLEP